MATWKQVEDYVRANFRIQQEHGDILTMRFEVVGGRTQLVSVRPAVSGEGEEWIDIISPVGEQDRIDVVRAAEIAETYLCGGVITEGGLVFVRHSAPIVNWEPEELEHPLSAVLLAADEMEKKLLGVDNL